jgi:transglutaminase-like putative cysteine protease
VDRQTRVTSVLSNYSRFVTRLENVSGVEDQSQITIIFDPRNEKLHLHSVRVVRGTEVIDQLRKGQIRVLQRESDLERGILDGDLTFHLLLSDVRVGDTIDTSYTIERRSPEWRNRYYQMYRLQWDDPVVFARVRVLLPVGDPFHIRSHGTDAPRQWTAGGWAYTEWAGLRAPAFQFEKHAPGWLQQHKSVEFSQFADWAEIVEQARQLYEVATRPSQELVVLSEKLKSMGSTDEDRAIAVMRFVQDEVRYTGIEEGEDAFRPTPPNDVLHRRYGDCKDKTLLAVSLLRRIGIEAAPALVSTRWREHVDDYLPSPGAMNHAVVRARIGGQTYWFDATTTGQGGGRLPYFTQAHFGAALTVAPRITRLETMPNPRASSPLIDSSSTFDFRAGVHANATLEVSTIYSGEKADAERRKLRAGGSVDLEKQYLHYYMGRYPDAVLAAPLRVQDDLDKNLLTIDESYRIDGAFEPDKKGKEVFEFNAESVTDELKAPDTVARLTPLAVNFPTYVASTIQVLLPTDWDVKEDVEKVDTPAFHYDSKITHAQNRVTLEYRYQALVDHVPIAQVGEYLKALHRAKDDTYFYLSQDADGTPQKNRTSAFDGLKLIFVAGSTYLAIRLARFVLLRQRQRKARAAGAAPI